MIIQKTVVLKSQELFGVQEYNRVLVAFQDKEVK